MDRKATGIVAYIGIIGWIIAYVAGDKEGGKFHLNQALVLDIAAIVMNVLSVVPVVKYVAAVFSLVIFVFAIMGIISAAKNEDKPLPVIGNIQILK